MEMESNAGFTSSSVWEFPENIADDKRPLWQWSKPPILNSYVNVQVVDDDMEPGPKSPSDEPDSDGIVCPINVLDHFQSTIDDVASGQFTPSDKDKSVKKSSRKSNNTTTPSSETKHSASKLSFEEQLLNASKSSSKRKSSSKNSKGEQTRKRTSSGSSSESSRRISDVFRPRTTSTKLITPIESDILFKKVKKITAIKKENGGVVEYFPSAGEEEDVLYPIIFDEKDVKTVLKHDSIEKLNPKKWTVDQVEEYLCRHSLHEEAKCFKLKGIDGTQFIEMNKQQSILTTNGTYRSGCWMLITRLREIMHILDARKIHNLPKIPKRTSTCTDFVPSSPLEQQREFEERANRRAEIMMKNWSSESRSANQFSSSPLSQSYGRGRNQGDWSSPSGGGGRGRDWGRGGSRNDNEYGSRGRGGFRGRGRGGRYNNNSSWGSENDNDGHNDDDNWDADNQSSNGGWDSGNTMTPSVNDDDGWGSETPAVVSSTVTPKKADKWEPNGKSSDDWESGGTGWETDNKTLGKHDEWNSSKKDDWNTTKTDDWNSSKKDDWTTSKKDDWNSSKADDWNTSKKDDWNSSKKDDWNSSKKDDWNSSKKDDWNSSKKDDWNTSKKDDWNISKADDWSSSKTSGWGAESPTSKKNDSWSSKSKQEWNSQKWNSSTPGNKDDDWTTDSQQTNKTGCGSKSEKFKDNEWGFESTALATGKENCSSNSAKKDDEWGSSTSTAAATEVKTEDSSTPAEKSDDWDSSTSTTSKTDDQLGSLTAVSVSATKDEGWGSTTSTSTKKDDISSTSDLPIVTKKEDDWNSSSSTCVSTTNNGDSSGSSTSAVPVVIKTQDEWGSSTATETNGDSGSTSTLAPKDDWGSSTSTAAPKDDWGSSTSTPAPKDGWGSSTSTAAPKDDWGSSTSAATKSKDDWGSSTSTTTTKDEWDSTSTPSKRDDWNSKPKDNWGSGPRKPFRNNREDRGSSKGRYFQNDDWSSGTEIKRARHDDSFGNNGSRSKSLCGNNRSRGLESAENNKNEVTAPIINDWDLVSAIPKVEFTQTGTDPIDWPVFIGLDNHEKQDCTGVSMTHRFSLIVDDSNVIEPNTPWYSKGPKRPIEVAVEKPKREVLVVRQETVSAPKSKKKVNPQYPSLKMKILNDFWEESTQESNAKTTTE